VSLLGFLRRRRRDDVDVAVLGSGLPATAVALELARRGRSASVMVRSGGEGQGPAQGLVALGPPQAYSLAVAAFGRERARVIWSGGRTNLERVRSWLREAGDDCGFEERGTFLLAADRAEAQALAESEDMLRDDGFPGEFLDHYMLETHFDVSGFPAAYWAADGGALDVTRLLPAVAAAARTAGARFCPARVRALEVGDRGVVVETEEGPVRAATAVVATDCGAGSLVPDLAPALGMVAGARLRVPLEAGASLPTAARTADGRVAWQVVGESLALAATGVVSPRDDRAEARDLAGLLDGLPVRREQAQRRATPGETPPDGLPLVGTLRGRPLAVACGFGAHASCLAFAAAGWVADALIGGTDPTPEPFRATRVEDGSGAV
jgi:glycine/D-amino acid oxidase-like deaminating enzyme